LGQIETEVREFAKNEEEPVLLDVFVINKIKEKER